MYEGVIAMQRYPVLCVIASAVIVIFGCRTLSISECHDLNEKLNAENRLLNKKNVMITRQNSIYAEENIALKKNLDQKNAQFQKLREDSESLERKLRGDIALLEGRNKNLMEKNRILEAESSEKIKELTELNKDLEKKLGEEIAKLNETLKKQSEDASREKEVLTLQMAQIEYQMAKKLEEQKKITVDREAEIADLKAKNTEMAIKITELVKKLEESQAAIKRLEEDLRTVKENAVKTEPARGPSDTNEPTFDVQKKTPEEKKQ